MAVPIEFYSGNTETMNYTPGSDVAAGIAVTVGALVGVTHRPIPANTLGALHIDGGIYNGIGNGVIAAGTVVYFDTATNKFTSTAGALKKFGTSITACGGDGQAIRVAHISNNT